MRRLTLFCADFTRLLQRHRAGTGTTGEQLRGFEAGKLHGLLPCAQSAQNVVLRLFGVGLVLEICSTVHHIRFVPPCTALFLLA